MMRSCFFAMGLFVALWGVSFMMVDKVTLNMKAENARPSGFRGMFTGVSAERKQVFDPPDWAAWSLLSVGTVTMLYSVALPKKPQ